MRRYQSAQSRFSQPDPYEGSYNLTDPQSLNRYAYTQNDPVNFVDPSGLNAEAPTPYGSCNGGRGIWLPNENNGGQLNCVNNNVVNVNISEGSIFGRVIEAGWGIGDDFYQGRIGRTPLQDPPEDIHTRIAPALRQIAQQSREYQRCLARNPRLEEFNTKYKLAALNASLPIPSTGSLMTSAYNGSRARRAGRAVLTLTNVYQPLIQGIVVSLLWKNAMFPGEVDRLEQELIRPWEQECKKQVYGL
jgi:hypothetical protein